MAAAAAAQAPAWSGKHGIKRLQLEFRDIVKQASEGKVHYEIELVGDDWRRWRIKLPPACFDDDLQGGKDLRQDLLRLGRETGAGYIVMEAKFPDNPSNYPTEPFKLRVVYPRCVAYTGHVTIGGSICIEALTLSGGPGAWQPSYCVESIMQIVICNAIDCDIKTVNTPGGVQWVGPLRVDFNRRRTAMRDEYSEAEAEAAFSRMLQHHSANGWGSGDGDNGGGRAGGGGGGGSGRGGRRGGAAAAAGAPFGGMPALADASLTSGGFGGSTWAHHQPSMGMLQAPLQLPLPLPLPPQPMQFPLPSGAVLASALDKALKNPAGAAKGWGVAPPANGSLGRRTPIAAPRAPSPPRVSANLRSAGAGATGGARWASPAKPSVAIVVDLTEDDGGSTPAMKRQRTARQQQQPLLATRVPPTLDLAFAASGAPAQQHGPRAGRARGQRQQLQQPVPHAGISVDLTLEDEGTPPREKRRRAEEHPRQTATAAAPAGFAWGGVAGGSGAGVPSKLLQRLGADSIDLSVVQEMLGQGMSENELAQVIGIDLSGADNDIMLVSPPPVTGAPGAPAAAAAAEMRPASTVAVAGGKVGSKDESWGSGTAAEALRKQRRQEQSEALRHQQQQRQQQRETRDGDEATDAGTAAGAAAGAAPGTEEEVARHRREIERLKKRLERASKAAADAEAEKQRVELEKRQLAEAEARARAEARAQAKAAREQAMAAAAAVATQRAAGRGSRLRADLPEHWAQMSKAEEESLKLVELPLPADMQAAGAAATEEDREAARLAAEAAALPRHWVEELAGNGLSREDAVAALLKSGGDVGGAIEYHFASLGAGGAAKAFEAERQQQRRRAAASSSARREDERQRKLEEEARQVVSLFLQQMGQQYWGAQHHGSGRRGRRGGGGGGGVAVRFVERVQNWKLWTAYTVKKEHIQDELGALASSLLNEHQLWHGTPALGNIYSILSGGFKAQYSNLSGALGAGVYFAGNATYSHYYSAGQAQNTGAGLRATPGLASSFGMLGAPINPWAPPAGLPMAGFGPGGVAQQPQAAASHVAPPQGHQWRGRYAMLLCKVTLGNLEVGRPGMRICSPGHHGVSNSDDRQLGRSSNDIYAVFDNNQAYPEYIVHYDL